MILALVLVSVQLIIIHLSENTRLITDRKKIVWVSLGLVFMLVQILSGTQIRQQIDELAKAFPREDWIQYLGVVFKFHRSFANLILLTALIIIWRSYKNRGKLQRKEVLLVTLVLMEIGAGIALSHFGMPPVFQPVHLLIGIAIFTAFLNIIFEPNHDAKS
jgi:cytochrome c oxidase assembly protein subunit 15